MNTREFVFAAFDNKETERVPVSFWFHFAPDRLFEESEEVLQKNIEGHRAYVKAFHPDFIKLMSDGYFTLPYPEIREIHTAADLSRIKSGHAEEWISKQVKLVSTLVNSWQKEIPAFYNIFAPATYLKWLLEKQNVSFGALVTENPSLVRDALNEIAIDIAELSRQVIAAGGADGIYLSAQNIQDAHLTKEEYLSYIAPSELTVLNAANEVSDYNILHICGYEGARNDLSTYVDYPAKILNWAVTVEGVSLEEGKKLFGGRAVIGGYANTEKDLLYRGTKGEIQTYAAGLLHQAGTRGVALGADCTIPSDTPYERLEWVREAAAAFKGGLHE